MGMNNGHDLDTPKLIGAVARSTEGNRIGVVGIVVHDQQSRRPIFVSVRTGLLGAREAFMPLAGARLDDEGLLVPFSSALVRDAPEVTLTQGDLSEVDQQRLLKHYHLDGGREAR